MRSTFLLLLIAVIVVPAFAEEWPMYRHDNFLTARSDGTGNLTLPEISWKYDLRGYKWYLALQASEGEHNIELHAAAGESEFKRDDLGLGRDKADLAGDGTLRPTKPYAAKILKEHPGLQTFNVQMIDGERGYCELIAFDEGEHPVWQSEEFRVFQGPHPVIADANADGQLDVVVCPHYQVAVLDGRTGETIQRLKWHDGRNYGHFIVKNIDDDPALEMCVLADFYTHIDMIDNDGTNLTLLWRKEIELKIESKSKILRPRWDCLQDLDADGKYEVVVNLYNDTGDRRWHLMIYDAISGETTLDLPGWFMEGLDDLDGDGIVELFCTETSALFVPESSHLQIINYRNGKSETRWSHPSGAWMLAEMKYPLYINSNVAHADQNIVITDLGNNEKVFYIRTPSDNEKTAPHLQSFKRDRSGAISPLWSLDCPEDSRSFLVETPGDANTKTDTLVSFHTSHPSGTVHLNGVSGEIVGQERIQPEYPQWGSLIAACLGDQNTPTIITTGGNRDVISLSVQDREPKEQWRISGAGPFAAADYDGNGSREVAMLAWQMNGEGCAQVVDSRGKLLWKQSIPGFPGPLEPWNFGTLTCLAAGRFTGENRDDLLVFARRSTMHSDEGFLLNGRSGEAVWQRDHSFDGSVNWGFGGTPVAVFDHNNDGAEDIHSLYPVNYTVVDGRNGEQLIGISAAGDDIFPKIWGAYCTPVTLDFNGDNERDILWCSQYVVGMTNLAGLTQWATPSPQQIFNDTHVITQAYPIDWNGSGEWRIAALGGPFVHCFDARSGNLLWRFPLTDKADFGLVADLNGEPGDELIVVQGDRLSAIGIRTERPELLWTFSLPSKVKDAILADIDGDRQIEITAVAMDGFLYRIDQSVIAAGANDIVLKPEEGLTFVEEPGVRITHLGFNGLYEPDCQVFYENAQPVYRLWWTTRAYADQQLTNENRWSAHVSISSDGLHFDYERGPEFATGRFTNRTDRDLLRLPDGGWRAYTLAGGGNPWYCIDSYRAGSMARDWTWEEEMRINFGNPGDWDHTGARGPEAVLLPDGSIRVYYIGWNGSEGPYVQQPKSGERWRILSAISKDGVNFTKEAGVRIDADPNAKPPNGPVSMSKPQVVRLSDGRYRMIFAAESESAFSVLFSAVSENGLSWQREPGIRLVNEQGEPVYGVCPSLVRTAEGKYRLYYDGEGGIRSAVAR